jgi:hypothetical protein
VGGGCLRGEAVRALILHDDEHERCGEEQKRLPRGPAWALSCL